MARWRERLRERVGDRKLIVRVDRTELSKNIVRGLEAFGELLRKRPEWRDRVTHLAFAYPSRSGVAEYRAYTESVRATAEAINAEFGTDDWTPVVLEVNDDYPRSLASYQIADVLLVNPIRDGMNLVAKEGPVLSLNGVALVLSTEAGAADDLGADAILVNPYDVSETAEALHRALTMDEEERRQRRNVWRRPLPPCPRSGGSPTSCGLWTQPSRWQLRPGPATGRGRTPPPRPGTPA